MLLISDAFPGLSQDPVLVQPGPEAKPRRERRGEVMEQIRTRCWDTCDSALRNRKKGLPPLPPPGFRQMFVLIEQKNQRLDLEIKEKRKKSKKINLIKS